MRPVDPSVEVGGLYHLLHVFTNQLFYLRRRKAYHALCYAPCGKGLFSRVTAGEQTQIRLRVEEIKREYTANTVSTVSATNTKVGLRDMNNLTLCHRNFILLKNMQFIF